MKTPERKVAHEPESRSADESRRGFGNLTGAVAVLLLAPIFLGACSSASLSTVRGDNPDFTPVAPIQPIPPEYNNGGIFQAGQGAALFEDNKARRVGDILTVILTERTEASKSANTSTSKTNSIDIPNPTIFGRVPTRNGIPIFNASAESSRSFGGEGTSTQSNELDGAIAVVVAEVLANGNLVVQGEKWLSLNQGDEFIRMRGIVRPVDIRGNNTIPSTEIANIQIAYGGRGALADSNNQGWLTRFFNSPVWPF
jgi:flagellar L-ring protein precursor FlgH